MGTRRMRRALLTSYDKWIVFRLEPAPDDVSKAIFTYSEVVRLSDKALGSEQPSLNTGV